MCSPHFEEGKINLSIVIFNVDGRKDICYILHTPSLRDAPLKRGIIHCYSRTPLRTSPPQADKPLRGDKQG